MLSRLLLLLFTCLGTSPALAAATLRIDEQRSLSIGLGLRASVGLSLQEPGKPLPDLVIEGVLAGLTGQLANGLRVQLNLIRAPAGEVRVLDAVAQLELDPRLSLWAGRMLPPGDRASLSGPLFQALWDAPFTSAYPGLPGGRDDGLALFGQVLEGKLKYQVGAFRGRRGTSNAEGNLLFTGRFTLNLLDPEPGYYTMSTYHGTKQLLALAVAARAQAKGAGTAEQPGLWSALSADLLFEKQFGPGVFTLDSAWYRYDLGGVRDDTLVEGQALSLSVAWLFLEPLGPGKIQPAVRYQQLFPRASPASTATLARSRQELCLNYLLVSHFIRLGLALSRDETAPADDSSQPTLVYAAKLGVQLIL